MKPHHRTAALLLILILLCCTVASSQTFTRITAGPWGTDVAASRSVNWVDYDNDGFLDLFISNGLEGGQQNFLYRNNHDGTCTKISTGPLVTGHAPSDGSSWADYDNDGDLNAVVVAWYDSTNAFFENSGNGTFVQILFGPVVNDRGYSETCSWGDYDNDGYVDLFVSNSGGPSVGGPKVNFLYRNNHDRTFTKIIAGEIAIDAFYSRGASWVDYDNDGDIDMFVVNERGHHENLYRNMLKESGIPTFSKITTGQIVNDGGNTMSASWGDADNDGDLDVVMTNGWPAGSLNTFYLNNGDRTFTKVLNDTLVRSTGYHMGSAWGDFDNDGDLDLFVTTAYGPSASKNEVFKNMVIETGIISFQRIGTGDIATDVGWSYGCAWGDYDRDGDIDLFVAKTLNENENNAFYRNDNANGNHWLEVRCVGVTSNRSGVGTKIRIKATINGQQRWQLREVDGQNGYCGQTLDQHFGLGNAAVIDSMKVEWPSGAIDVYTNVATDRIVVVQEGTSLTLRNVPTAYPTIQAAINASVNGDTVLVAPGTYAENIAFRGKNIVVTSRYILNMDPTYIQNTIINGGSPSHPDSGSCVRIVNGEDSSAVLQGFTLTGGHGTLWQDEHGPGRYWEGGGVFIALSSPTVRFNILRANDVNRTGGASTGGGGIRLGDGAPRILNNIVMGNAGMYGGGIVSNYASPTIRNNIIAYNVVSQGVAGPTYGGGGLWFNGAVAGNKVDNNTIVGNSSSGGGSSGAQGRGGGMIAVFGATINARNNVVWGNTQTTGGQVAAVSATALVAYSDVEGGFAGQGNINLPPQFADTSFYLQSSSPCIDAGDTSMAFNDPPDPINPLLAKWPSRGGVRNDIGAYGGPLSRIIAGVVTSVGGKDEEDVPVNFGLSQNYPNPFNPNTSINFQLPASSFVSLKVFDILGREVTTLVEGVMQAGSHTSAWDAGDKASGTYICKLSAGEYSATQKVILMK